MIQFTPPWRQPPLDQWKILAMYHDKDGLLHVRMANDGYEIIGIGQDNREIWNNLYRKAMEFES